MKWLLILFLGSISSTSFAKPPNILDLSSRSQMLSSGISTQKIHHSVIFEDNSALILTTVITGEIPDNLVFQSHLLTYQRIKNIEVTVNNINKQIHFEKRYPQLFWVHSKSFRANNEIKIEYVLNFDSSQKYAFYELNNQSIITLGRYSYENSGWDLREKEALSTDIKVPTSSTVKAGANTFVVSNTLGESKGGTTAFPEALTSEFSLLFFNHQSWHQSSINILGTKFDLILRKSLNVISLAELTRAVQNAWPAIKSKFPIDIPYIALFENPNEPFGGGPFGENIFGLGAMNALNVKISENSEKTMSEIFSDFTGFPQFNSTKDLTQFIYSHKSNYWENYLTHITTHELMHLVFGLKQATALMPKGTQADSIFLGLGVLYDSLISLDITGMFPPIYEFPICEKFYSNPEIDQGIFSPSTESDSHYELTEFHRRNCYSHTRTFHIFSQLRSTIGANKFDALIKEYIETGKSKRFGYENGLRSLLIKNVKNYAELETELNILGNNY